MIQKIIRLAKTYKLSIEKCKTKHAECEKFQNNNLIIDIYLLTAPH